MADPKSRKIIIITGVCAAVIFLFWALIYFPAQKKFRALKAEFDIVKKDIAAIESRGGQRGRDIAAMVKSLYSDFDATADRLPYKEEESFKLIAKEANKAGLSVISMNPGERRPMLDVNNSHVFVENVQCFEIPINIEMQGGYKEIGEYLRSLREDVPVLIKVEDIVINKEGAGGSQLKAKAEFILHVLSQD